MTYEKTYEIRWADLDPNFHLRHTAYNDYAAQARLSCLAESGFTLQRFHTLKLGPVIFKETTEYFKEVRAGDKIRVSFAIAGVSEDGRKFRIAHDIFKGDGSKAATITIDGAWFNTETRKVAPAPPELQSAMQSYPKSENFQILP